jgi:hypothetical protein
MGKDAEEDAEFDRIIEKFISKERREYRNEFLVRLYEEILRMAEEKSVKETEN